MASTISKLNKSNLDDFVHIVGTVFEHSPWIAAAVWNQRPFADWKQLHNALCAVVISADDQRKLDLIQAHPKFVGQVAHLDELSQEEVASIQKQITAYREQFGFPYIVCASLNKKESILAGLEQRMKHSRDDEIQTALEEIFKIAELRLRDLIHA